ncbi:tRNA (cytosine(72)-C(5))-methyltransferase NSUN6 isoform X1 [Silurus meridionalis]|uniref:tRNA (cytosine(72)-C(5))-methyltransferase NSUN6 isoform X1 n=2 Tax=Silurus meridionalis TaxID=175797 RepID=UPI001EEC09EA|nr:tRNA (cytosine(72)-C(5))-methyltransferase NSUN6 isoform X1 [Silurus meridionalis]
MHISHNAACFPACGKMATENTMSTMSIKSVFPKVALKSEVQEYLHNVYMNKELVSELGEEEAEKVFDSLLSCLSHPPALTCLRASTHTHTLQDIQHRLEQHLAQVCQQGSDCCAGRSFTPIIHHPQLPDVLLLPVRGPRDVRILDMKVVVGAQCGSAVLRGAHVFAPGVLSAPKFMKAGDIVSVFSDVEGRCTRGTKDFQGNKVFVGNGVCVMNRSDIFCAEGPVRGVAIKMDDALYQSPSFDGVLPNEVFLQNLPSVVVGHVLGPRPGERILDMCAAPGGKTTHIAALMANQGVVVALDKIKSKVEKIRENADALRLHCIKAHCYNSIQAICPDLTHSCSAADAPPFPEESFDRILLDAPCSGLGQRPNMAINYSLKEVCSYQPLQRKLFRTAVQLMKKGGVLVYSTCTVTLAENEEQVAWALKTFPCLTLELQEPHLGSQGMPGAELSHDQLRLLQRFRPEFSWHGATDIHGPEDLLLKANTDTIGFFIAKFMKR